MNMDILPALPGFALAFILIFCYEYRIKLIKTKPKNNVHFFVARDMDGDLWFYIDKPIRGVGKFFSKINIHLSQNKFNYLGLNENDYANLKWEDEPVEVFINMKD